MLMTYRKSMGVGVGVGVGVGKGCQKKKRKKNVCEQAIKLSVWYSPPFFVFAGEPSLFLVPVVFLLTGHGTSGA